MRECEKSDMIESSQNKLVEAGVAYKEIIFLSFFLKCLSAFMMRLAVISISIRGLAPKLVSDD